MSETGPQFNINDLLAQAQQMQEQLLAAQAEAAEQVIEGQAGGGVVRITVNGALEFQSVTIAPEAVDPDDVDMLQDLVLAALHDAMAQVAEAQQGTMGGLGLGDLGGGGGGGLGGLGGILGS
jgi:nucleoid-associated protein EbfC